MFKRTLMKEVLCKGPFPVKSLVLQLFPLNETVKKPDEKYLVLAEDSVLGMDDKGLIFNLMTKEQLIFAEAPNPIQIQFIK